MVVTIEDTASKMSKQMRFFHAGVFPCTVHASEAKYNSVKSMLALSEEYTHGGGGGNLRRWGFFCPCLDARVNVPPLQG